MANEAVFVELLGDEGDGMEFTVADGTDISKGSLMTILDPRTAVKSTTTNGQAPHEKFAGIAAHDKEANDGATTLTLLTKGVFDLKLSVGSGAVSAGDLVNLSGANLITVATDDTIENHGLVVGKSLEDASANSEEQIEVLVGTR